MPTTARLRRFAPSLDCLPSRLTPSGAGVITPMDPVLLGWKDTAPPEVVVTPMDPVLLGWNSTPTSPPWVASAIAMGDGLIRP